MPQTPLGELTALSQTPVAGFKESTSKGRKDWKEGQRSREKGKDSRVRERREGEGREGKERGGKGKEREEGLRHVCWGMDAPVSRF